jgi:hypothetical protein
MELTPQQEKQHQQWGWEFYYENHTGKMEFSQVRTNMMEDVNYVPYCIPCPGLQRYAKTDTIGTLKCPNCKNVITYPKEFIDRFKAKHNLK